MTMRCELGSSFGLKHQAKRISALDGRWCGISLWCLQKESKQSIPVVVPIITYVTAYSQFRHPE